MGGFFADVFGEPEEIEEEVVQAEPFQGDGGLR